VSPDYPEIPPEAFGGPPPAAKPFCSTRRDCARSLDAGKIGEERERLKVRIRTRQRTKAQRPFPRSDYFESVSTAPRKALRRYATPPLDPPPPPPPVSVKPT